MRRLTKGEFFRRLVTAGDVLACNKRGLEATAGDAATVADAAAVARECGLPVQNIISVNPILAAIIRHNTHPATVVAYYELAWEHYEQIPGITKEALEQRVSR